MPIFKSIPNSPVNQTFLQNIEAYAKKNKVNQTSLISYLERRLFSVLDNSSDLIEVNFHSLQIEPRSGDIILNVVENGKLKRIINPRTSQPTREKWLPFSVWKQDGIKINVHGNPIDDNGLSEEEFFKVEEQVANFGWSEILFGKSWSDIFWGEPHESYFDEIAKINNQLLGIE